LPKHPQILSLTAREQYLYLHTTKGTKVLFLKSTLTANISEPTLLDAVCMAPFHQPDLD
jgi:hypothetical protein